MNKTWKTVWIISSIAVAFGTCLLVAAWNLVRPREIVTYHSPNGEYVLAFEQMGVPQWPFGPTKVRLTLKTCDGKMIERVSTQLSDDGANAGAHNLAVVSWNDDAVMVVLRASEMEDEAISIAYHKRSPTGEISQ